MQHTIHFLGIFRGEIQPHRPQTQLAQILLPIQPVEFLAVEQHAAASSTIPQHREFRTGLVHQPGSAQMTGALPCFAPDQTIFRDHQRHTAIGQQFCRNGLADIPHLGQRHLKAEHGRLQFQLLQRQHGHGIIHIQAKIAPHFHARFPGRQHQAQITHQGLLDAPAIELFQVFPQFGHLSIVDDSGRHRHQGHQLGQLPCEFFITGENMHGHIQRRRIHFQHRGSDLLLRGNLDGIAGGFLKALVMGNSGHGIHLPVFLAAAQCRQLIQRIPAHGIDAGSRNRQTGQQIRRDPHAAVRCTTGFGQTALQLLQSQFLGASRFRYGAGYGAAAAIRVHHRQRTDALPHHHMQRHIHQGILCAFIALAGSAHPGCFLILLFPNAEHFLAQLIGVIAIGKALAVKGRQKRIHHLLGDLIAIQSPTVNIRHHRHIFRPFHTALQLQRCHTHGLQLTQIGYHTVIFEAQRITVFPAAVAIALTARLRATTPVTAAATDGSRQIALSGIAHAQRAVGKYFNLNGRILADIADLFLIQFPAKHHPAHTPGCAQQHTGQGVHRHLGRSVQRHGRGNPPAQLNHAQILHDKCIHTGLSSSLDQLDAILGLPIGHQGVQSQMHLYPSHVAVFHRLGQGLDREIFRALTGIKSAAAQVNGIGAVLYRSPQCIHRACRSQQFDHTHSPQGILKDIISQSLSLRYPRHMKFA